MEKREAVRYGVMSEPSRRCSSLPSPRLLFKQGFIHISVHEMVALGCFSHEQSEEVKLCSKQYICFWSVLVGTLNRKKAIVYKGETRVTSNLLLKASAQRWGGMSRQTHKTNITGEVISLFTDARPVTSWVVDKAR